MAGEVRVRCVNGSCRVVAHGHRRQSPAGLLEDRRLAGLATDAGWRMRRARASLSLVASGHRDFDQFTVDAQFAVISIRVQRPDIVAAFGAAALVASVASPGECRWCLLGGPELRATPWAARFLLGNPCPTCAGRLGDRILAAPPAGVLAASAAYRQQFKERDSNDRKVEAEGSGAGRRGRAGAV